MNKLLFLLVLTVGWAGCQGNSGFKLQAELDDVQSDTLWMVYDDPMLKIDTIYTENGKFTYETEADTLNLCRLLSSEGKSIPVFVSPKEKMKLTGSFDAPVISGEGENAVYGEFLKSIDEIRTDTAAVRMKAKEFVRTHLQSFASAYIIHQFFIQSTQPDLEELASILAPLDGMVKDSYILGGALESIADKNKTVNKDYVSYFSCKDRKGKYVAWNNAPDSYTLINFWASWDPQSLVVRDSLEQIARKLPEKQFRVLNLSLDYGKEQWYSQCKEDAERWVEVCDFKAWDNQVIRQNGVWRLPANILVDRNRKIIARDLFRQDLYEKVKQLTDASK